MNKELVLILKEIKKRSEKGATCSGTKFINFKCLGVGCPNCVLTSVNQKHRYISQIVLVNL